MYPVNKNNSKGVIMANRCQTTAVRPQRLTAEMGYHRLRSFLYSGSSPRILN